jgi:hypothetical protein
VLISFFALPVLAVELFAGWTAIYYYMVMLIANQLAPWMHHIPGQTTPITARGDK